MGLLFFSTQMTFARKGDFSPQDLFFLPLMLIGVFVLFKFSAVIEKYTKDLSILLKIIIKGVCFLLFIGIIILVIIGMGLIFEYIPEKWSMLF
ncbi:hypothetical protein G9F32_10495 [Acinetobacter sp. 194]|uniref:hypothetical protein n=1 Tax=Acinetobacter shaoyimingii TaxID=2715164 RepID=UPI00140C03EB|nr:hypothetical protein [Acinetobacter shaoyimingii]NHB58439.1 hypothetical protein [Acinetobacter shaoyimingii]